MDLLKLQYLDGFDSYKHTAFCLHKMVIDGLESCGLLWIIVMLLSAVWALILTAPIHCRWFLGEHVMQCYIYPNLLWWRIYNMDDLRVSKICADFHICVKYSLNQYADSSGELWRSTPKSLSRKVSSLGHHICDASGQLRQDQVLSKWMGESWNLKNGSLNSRLNNIFQISNKIWNELHHECCFLCSNSV